MLRDRPSTIPVPLPKLFLTLFSALFLTLLLGGCVVQIGSRPLVSPQGVPLVASACKDGGWQTLRNNEGEPFRNQGECVSFTNSGQGF